MSKADEVEDFLEHFGVKGQKWGIRNSKRKTGVSRTSGAIMDRNARLESNIKKARAGTKYQKRVALNRKLLGEKQQNINWDTTLKTIRQQNKRMKNGEKTAQDRLDIFGTVALADLLISRTPR